MKTLYFIRHGISQHNVLFHNLGKRVFYDKRYYDTKLTSQGIEQAIKLRNTWEKLNEIELVICSPLTRTIQTTNHLFNTTNVNIISHDMLKEFPQGLQTINKRKEKSELQKLFPNIDFTEVNHVNNIWNPEREETIDELNQRIEKFREFIETRNETNIAIVGHNSFIGQFIHQKIPLMENGDKELLHCHPYEYIFE
tara:strand:- start:495 stop:1082 length:588 start_codon:yes stop_codon:yes gene_type:complete